MFTRNITSLLLAAAAVVALASQANASPTPMVHQDTPQCDFLFIPDDVEEIGDFNEFPVDEALYATDLGPSPLAPCPNTNLSLPDLVVDIRNLSGRVWDEVWYVADEGTTITNFDGEANQLGFPPLQEAFRIDRLVSDPGGSHHPLIGESMTQDGIWEINESWQFILQDYTNALGLPASAITSIGVGDASKLPLSGIIDSSGSIIGITKVIPEPASLMLACLGLGAFTGMRRRKSNR